MLLQLRKDGWTSLEADYVFNRPLEQLPQVTTTAQRVPRCPGAVELLLNAVTGVAGYVLVGVRGQARCALLAQLVDLTDGGTTGSAFVAATRGDRRGRDRRARCRGRRPCHRQLYRASGLVAGRVRPPRAGRGRGVRTPGGRGCVDLLGHAGVR